MIAVATYLLLPEFGLHQQQQAMVPPKTSIPESVATPQVPLTSDNQLQSDVKDDQKELPTKPGLHITTVNTTQPQETEISMEKHRWNVNR